MFAAYAAWSAREIELQALATLATLAQISTPSAAHFLKSHQLLVQKFAADRDRQRSSFKPFAQSLSHSTRETGALSMWGVGSRGPTGSFALVQHMRENAAYALGPLRAPKAILIGRKLCRH